MPLHFRLSNTCGKPYTYISLRWENCKWLKISSEMYQTKTYNSNRSKTVSLNKLTAWFPLNWVPNTDVSKSDVRELWWPVSSFHISRWIGFFMKRCLLVNEPTVSTPQDEVKEAKDNWGIESSHMRYSSSSTFVFGVCASLQKTLNNLRTGWRLHISQTFGPGGGRGQPEEGQKCSQQQVHNRGSGGLPVHMLVAQVQDEHGSAVQEAEHSNAHEELSRGRKVSNQVVVSFGAITFTVRYFERMLCHPKWIVEMCSYFLWFRTFALDHDVGGTTVASSCSKGKYREHPFKHTYKG